MQPHDQRILDFLASRPDQTATPSEIHGYTGENLVRLSVRLATLERDGLITKSPDVKNGLTLAAGYEPDPTMLFADTFAATMRTLVHGLTAAGFTRPEAVQLVAALVTTKQEVTSTLA